MKSTYPFKGMRITFVTSPMNSQYLPYPDAMFISTRCSYVEPRIGSYHKTDSTKQVKVADILANRKVVAALRTDQIV